MGRQRPVLGRWSAVLRGGVCHPGMIPVSGLLLSLAYAPGSWSAIAWVALVPFLSGLLSRSRGPREAARQGLLFGFCFNVALLHWILFLHPASESAHWWLLLPAVVGLSTFFALSWSLLGVLAVLLRSRLGAWALLVVPALQPGFEWLQAQGSWAFPWCSLGASQVESLTVLQIVSLIGSLGLTALLLLFNVAVTWLWHGVQRSAALGILVLLGIGIMGWGTICRSGTAGFQKTEGRLDVALVQPDVSQTVKWHPELQPYSLARLEQLTRLARNRGARFVIWPETSIPFDLLRDDRARFLLEELARDVVLLVGFPHREQNPRGTLRNRVALVTPNGIRTRYDKHNLLPWGERAPAVIDSPGVSMHSRTFSPGEPDVLFDIALDAGQGGHRFGVLVCFEVTFAKRARELRKQGAMLLVNPVNDGWFKGSVGPYQHAAFARVRAVETGLPVLRCANNGLSLVCGPRGDMLGIGPLGQRGVLLARIPVAAPLTPYVRWGDLPVLALCGGVFLLLLIAWFSCPPQASHAGSGVQRWP